MQQMARDTLKRMNSGPLALIPKKKVKTKKTVKKLVKKTGVATEQNGTFMTGAGLYNADQEVDTEVTTEEDVDDEEKKDKMSEMYSNMIGDPNSLLDEIRGDIKKFNSNTDNEDDLVWIRRKLKEVGGGIKRNGSGLREITDDFKKMNKNLKKLDIGIEDGLFDEMEDIMKCAESKNPYKIKTCVNANWDEGILEENLHYLKLKPKRQFH